MRRYLSSAFGERALVASMSKKHLSALHSASGCGRKYTLACRGFVLVINFQRSHRSAMLHRVHKELSEPIVIPAPNICFVHPWGRSSTEV